MGHGRKDLSEGIKVKCVCVNGLPEVLYGFINSTGWAINEVDVGVRVLEI